MLEQVRLMQLQQLQQVKQGKRTWHYWEATGKGFCTGIGRSKKFNRTRVDYGTWIVTSSSALLWPTPGNPSKVGVPENGSRT